MKRLWNKEQGTDFDDIKDSVLKSPIFKVLIIGAGVLAVVGISGYVFKLVNFSMSNLRELQFTIKKK